MRPVEIVIHVCICIHIQMQIAIRVGVKIADLRVCVTEGRESSFLLRMPLRVAGWRR